MAETNDPNTENMAQEMSDMDMTADNTSQTNSDDTLHTTHSEKSDDVFFEVPDETTPDWRSCKDTIKHLKANETHYQLDPPGVPMCIRTMTQAQKDSVLCMALSNIKQVLEDKRYTAAQVGALNDTLHGRRKARLWSRLRGAVDELPSTNFDSLAEILIDMRDDVRNFDANGLHDPDVVSYVKSLHEEHEKTIENLAQKDQLTAEQAAALHASQQSKNELTEQFGAARARLICKMCLVRECDCVYLNCGHISCCMGCADNSINTNTGDGASSCPFCRAEGGYRKVLIAHCQSIAWRLGAC